MLEIAPLRYAHETSGRRRTAKWLLPRVLRATATTPISMVLPDPSPRPFAWALRLRRRRWQRCRRALRRDGRSRTAQAPDVFTDAVAQSRCLRVPSLVIAAGVRPRRAARIEDRRRRPREASRRPRQAAFRAASHRTDVALLHMGILEPVLAESRPRCRPQRATSGTRKTAAALRRRTSARGKGPNPLPDERHAGRASPRGRRSRRGDAAKIDVLLPKGPDGPRDPHPRARPHRLAREKPGSCGRALGWAHEAFVGLMLALPLRCSQAGYAGVELPLGNR